MSDWMLWLITSLDQSVGFYKPPEFIIAPDGALKKLEDIYRDRGPNAFPPHLERVGKEEYKYRGFPLVVT